MKVAIVGSRNLNISEIQEYLPKNISEIISGGAKGVDTCARRFAQNNNIKLTEYLYFLLISPQAIFKPESPAGWVVKSSRISCITTVFPMISSTAKRSVSTSDTA